jgi:hypothetical protein
MCLLEHLAGGGLKGMDRKIAIANMVKNGMLLGAVTLLYTWAVGDDEEYQKLDDQTRARGFFIPGSKEVFGEPLILPMSTGASFFFKTVPEIAYNQVMRDGTETKWMRRACVQLLVRQQRTHCLGQTCRLPP